MSRRSYWAVLWALVLVAGGSGETQARSTLIARFAHRGIAGPQIEQTAILYLHCFPGDGEAVVGAEVEYDAALFQVRSAHSARGAVRAVEPALRIDYSSRPLAREAVDTLRVDLVARRGGGEGRWQAAIYSSLAVEGPRAHEVALSLAVEPPPRLEFELQPAQVFPGEHRILRLVVRNADERPIEEATWDWPEGLVLLEGAAHRTWPGGLQPGAGDTLLWQVRVERRESGSLSLEGRARVGGLVAAPVGAVHVSISAAPLGRLEEESPLVEVGRPRRLVYVWSAPDGERVGVEALRLELGTAFADVALDGQPQGATATVAEGGQGTYVLVKGIGALEPGQAVQVALELRSRRPGPFSWKSFWLPAGAREFLPVRAGPSTVRSVRALDGESGRAAEERLAPTDLQMASRAFAGALDDRLADLPLAEGTPIFLVADEKSERNWVVEDALIEALMRRGYRIRLSPPSAGEIDQAVMHYRLVEARVVYRPVKKGLKFWGGRLQRQIDGDLFLRLETAADKVVRWDRRVGAYATDVVPGGSAEALGGTDVIKRTIVQPENKIIERGLSASIIGGLFYIFFIL